MAMKLNIVQRTFILVVMNLLFQTTYGVVLMWAIDKQDVPDITKLIWVTTLATSMALSCLINILCAWMFSKGLQVGFYTVHDNINKIRQSRPLNAPLEGNDELVDIDYDVHLLARSLGRG
ncbi:MAG TPA: hypothetical protein V6C97_05965 [Oculatellaceae cyanobacterium]